MIAGVLWGAYRVWRHRQQAAQPSPQPSIVVQPAAVTVNPHFEPELRVTADLVNTIQPIVLTPRVTCECPFSTAAAAVAPAEDAYGDFNDAADWGVGAAAGRARWSDDASDIHRDARARRGEAAQPRRSKATAPPPEGDDALQASAVLQTDGGGKVRLSSSKRLDAGFDSMPAPAGSSLTPFSPFAALGGD